MEELLDDRLDEHQSLIRIPTIVRLEKLLIVGYGVVIVWTLIRYMFGIMMSITDLTFLIHKELFVMVIVIWWGRDTFFYDKNYKQKKFTRHRTLHVLRGLVWLMVFFSFLERLSRMIEYSYISDIEYIVRFVASILWNLFTIKYLLLTNKIEKAIH